MRFTGPDPAASPFHNLHAYCGNNPAGAYDPDGLSSKGLRFFLGGNDAADNWFFDMLDDLSDGFGYAAENETRREYAQQTFGVRVFDMATLGLVVTDNDYKALGYVASTQGTQAMSGFESGYRGGTVAGVTMHVAAAALTGGASTVTAAPGAGLFAVRTAWAIRGVAGTTMLAGSAYTGYEAGTAVGDVAFNGAEWTTDTTVKVAAFGLTVGGAGLGRTIGRLRGPKPPGPACFVAGTEVLAASSAGAAATKPVEKIKVGDWVWSRNEETGEEGFKPVVQLFRSEADTLVHLTYTTSATATPATLTGTPEHPFWSVDAQAWVGMQELTRGETLLLAHGMTATVTNTRIEHMSRPVTVYNFEVADWHTYHVGTPETGWVYVHNTCVVGPYRTTGGHHIHAQSAFTGHPKYNGGNALSIGQQSMKANGWVHGRATAAQQQLFRALARTNRVDTASSAELMKIHNRIAELSLRKAGVPQAEARILVAQSLRNLRRQGVQSPARTPWKPGQ